MKTARIVFVLLLATAGVAVLIALLPRTQPANLDLPPDATHPAESSHSSPTPPTVSETGPLTKPVASAVPQPVVPEARPERLVVATNKLDRLAQIREAFRVRAGGDKTNALRAAKQIIDETERETALLTLVTEWTQGELSAPRLRAQRIANLGLEAGLGIELGKYPELALLWANELTEGAGRAAVLQQAARFMVDSDPNAAFAMTGLVPEGERRSFSDALFAGWAGRDTARAVRWANQLPDPAQRDQAIQAIRSVAPVGIGTALRLEDGYPVIQELVPGTPAQLSGQLRVGDRIVALARGDNLFVDIHGLPLEDIVQTIRGAPRTLIQLQVVAADAPPNSPPRTISIMRDQINFKREEQTLR